MMLKRVGHIALAASILAGLTFSLITPALADNDSGKTRVVITSKSAFTNDARQKIAKSANGRIKQSIDSNSFSVELSKNNLSLLKKAAENEASDSNIQSDPVARAATVPNDPCIGGCNADWGGGQMAKEPQWALFQTNTFAAWDKTKGSSSVLVAVVDSGVDGSIPELSGRVTKEIDEIPGQARDATHGTEVASIIAANTNNASGIAGMSWYTKILSVRVLPTGDVGSLYDVAKGIRDAADNGAKIINVSVGGSTTASFLSDAVNYAESKGSLVVAAAGNTHDTSAFYPASYSNVLSVSGTDNNNDNFDFKYGSWVNVYAPARRVLAISTDNKPTVVSGTSFASPQVSGAAALLKAEFPTATPEGIRAMIKTTAIHVTGLQTRAVVPLLNTGAAVSAKGYWEVATNGTVRNEGSAYNYGHPSSLSMPIMGMASTASGKGYWLVAADGGVFSYGDAKFYGSTGNIHLTKPIVGMARTASGNGYWLVASDGGIFSYGDAKFYGSAGALKLAKPIVGMSTTASGRGYWLVASDGGIFSYGDAKFHGSTGNLKLVSPVVGMTRTASGNGYWLVAADGGVFSYGDAKFYGAESGHGYTSIRGIVRTPTGAGYWIFGSGGTVFALGDAKFWGDGRSAGLFFVGIAA